MIIWNGLYKSSMSIYETLSTPYKDRRHQRYPLALRWSDKTSPHVFSTTKATTHTCIVRRTRAWRMDKSTHPKSVGVNTFDQPPLLRYGVRCMQPKKNLVNGGPVGTWPLGAELRRTTNADDNHRGSADLSRKQARNPFRFKPIVCRVTQAHVLRKHLFPPHLPIGSGV